MFSSDTVKLVALPPKLDLPVALRVVLIFLPSFSNFASSCLVNQSEYLVDPR